jgi:hypothetical protein
MRAKIKSIKMTLILPSALNKHDQPNKLLPCLSKMPRCGAQPAAPALPALWNVYPVECGAYSTGAEPIHLGRSLFL